MQTNELEQFVQKKLLIKLSAQKSHTQPFIYIYIYILIEREWERERERERAEAKNGIIFKTLFLSD